MTARGISSAQPLATHNQTKNASQHSQNHASGQARKNSAVYVSLSSDKLVKQQHLKRIKILKTHHSIQTSIPAHSSPPKSQNQNRTKLIKRPHEPHVHIRRSHPHASSQPASGQSSKAHQNPAVARTIPDIQPTAPTKIQPPESKAKRQSKPQPVPRPQNHNPIFRQFRKSKSAKPT